VVIPEEFAKNGLSHRVPLKVQAVNILEELHHWLEHRLDEVNVGRGKRRL
jgi:hypothetical protein